MIKPEDVKSKRRVRPRLISLTNALIMIIIALLIALLVATLLMGRGDGCHVPPINNIINSCCTGAGPAVACNNTVSKGEVNTVPEPSSLALVGLGVAVIWARKLK